MDVATLAPHLEKLLDRIAKNRAGIDTLSAAASGNAELLANALWQLVRDGKGALLGPERPVVAKLAPGTFDAHDFLNLLRQLKGANLFWFERWDDRVDGLAYHGWSKELDEMLEKLLATGTDRTPLEWADVSEPAGSSLLFALARRGIVPANVLPPDALSRLGKAFLCRASWSEEQFKGWERVWDVPTFATAVFAAVEEVKEVGVYPDTIEPLLPYATPKQLALVVEKMVWPDHRALKWLAARGKSIVPFLQQRLEELLDNATQGYWISGRKGRHVGALARIRAEEKLSWPAEWMPVAKAMLHDDTAGTFAVLEVVDTREREEMLLEHLANENNWRDKLWPLTRFPSPRLVEALVKLIRETPKNDGWDYEREPLFKTLGEMGDAGQKALVRLLDEPDQTEGAVANLRPTKAHALKTLSLLASTKSTLAEHAQNVWRGLSADELIELVDGHLDAIPPAVAAQLLADVNHHSRTADLAARLQETEQNRALRRYCLTRPEPLPALVGAMAKVPADALERAGKALAPMFAERTDYKFKLADALHAFGPDDLPAIVQVTARKVKHRWSDMETLCRHFWPARPEIPWVAIFWWSAGDYLTIAAIERAVGAAIVEPLRARIETGHLLENAWPTVIRIMAEHDVLESVDLFIQWAANPALRQPIVDAMVRALEKGSSKAREWVRQALDGKQRELALEILGRQPVPELAATLEALKKEKLPAKIKTLHEGALAALKAPDGILPRSKKTISAKLLHSMGGVIETLHLSADGKTLCAQAAGELSIWKGKKQATIGDLGAVRIEMSADGRFLLVVDEFDVQVYEPWKSTAKPRSTLNPDDGLGFVAPMPGGRAFTLCAAHNAYTPLTLWDLETGDGQVHKLSGFPVHVALIDDQRYVLGDMNGKITIRLLDTGKVTGKLQGWSNHDGEGICMVASGDGGKIVATLFFDGSLMIWDISGPKVKALGRHLRAAPKALVSDPGSPWIVTAGTTEVLTWKKGQPAQKLTSPGPVAERREWHFEDAALAVFIRPNIVAIGGQCVDVWDLNEGEHLCCWDKPITTLATAAGKLVAGDAEGKIWQIDVAANT